MLLLQRAGRLGRMLSRANKVLIPTSLSNHGNHLSQFQKWRSQFLSHPNLNILILIAKVNVFSKRLQVVRGLVKAKGKPLVIQIFRSSNN
jgi:hypothetical protein